MTRQKNEQRFGSRLVAITASLALIVSGVITATAAHANGVSTKLSSLSVSAGPFEDAFSPDRTDYYLAARDTTTAEMSSTTVTFSEEDAASTDVEYKVGDSGTFAPLVSGVTSINLPAGTSAAANETKIIVRVTDGVSPTDYNIFIRRGAPWPTNLIQQCAATPTPPCVQKVELTKGGVTTDVTNTQSDYAVRLEKGTDKSWIIRTGRNTTVENEFYYSLSDVSMPPLSLLPTQIDANTTVAVTVNMGVDASTTPGYLIYTTGTPGTYKSEEVGGYRMVTWAGRPMEATVLGMGEKCDFTSCEPQSPGNVYTMLAITTVLQPADGSPIPQSMAGGYAASNAAFIQTVDYTGKFSFQAAGPSKKADGTPVTASFQMSLPLDAIEQEFGVITPEAEAALYEMVRDNTSENVSGVEFAVNQASNSITASLASFTFSTPKYTWSASPGGAALNPVKAKKVKKVVTLLARSKAVKVKSSTIKKKMSTKAAKAPTFKTKKNKKVALVGKGAVAGLLYSAQIRVGKKYGSLGKVLAQPNKTLAIPVISISKSGTYQVRFKNPETNKYLYFNVVVK